MDDDVIQTVTDAVVETAAAETAAVTAQAAAESTVVAAQTAVALAEAQSAQAQMDAARQVQIVCDDVEQVEENVLWLRRELETHQTMDRNWKTEMERRLQEILEVTRHLMQSEVSTPQISEPVTEVQNPNQVPSQSSGPEAAPQEVETKSRPKNRRTYL